MNIRAKLPEKEYTKKTLEARGISSPKPGTFVPGITVKMRQLPRFHGNRMEPRVDFRRVAPSRLLEGTLPINTSIFGQNASSFRF